MKKEVTICFLLLCAGFPACTRHALLMHPENKAFSRQAPPVFDVLLETTKGNIRMEVTRQWSPHGADRFYNLVRNGYYDHAAFFRIRKGTWAQFGIAADPRIARAWRGQNIPDDSLKTTNARGTVDFAFKDHNGRTTQVFINLRDNSSTHDKEPFVPFARVIEGMDVADALYDEYGEKAGGGIRGGKQDSLFAEGNAWLTRKFPRLDYILHASIYVRLLQ
jgi:peptidyl-prolyl cis-trans isomerase A (cyclophilin A)